MPFKEHDHEIQLQVNKDALRQNIRSLKLHARQIKESAEKENPIDRLNKLFVQKEQPKKTFYACYSPYYNECNFGQNNYCIQCYRLKEDH